ncbi:Os05g0376300 [Oryza sativa Japonica Group]|uniref:Os05g0376300 protein n=1 Tax=Oryza sativa subsp. japonica TaxID=39947 RepID=A0A0P0WLI7_ORYSJ|nr:Os05g0376300 [Oryza sativa Japonica Group]
MTRGEKGMQPKISAFFKRQAPEPETSRFFILVPSSNLLAVAIRYQILPDSILVANFCNIPSIRANIKIARQVGKKWLLI